MSKWDFWGVQEKEKEFADANDDKPLNLEYFLLLMIKCSSGAYTFFGFWIEAYQKKFEKH